MKKKFFLLSSYNDIINYLPLKMDVFALKNLAVEKITIKKKIFYL